MLDMKKAIYGMVKDKLENMEGSEISSEVYGYVKVQSTKVADKAWELIAHDEIVNKDCGLTFHAGFNTNLIGDWDAYYDIPICESLCRIQYDALYNYDALWMTAIQEAFPNKFTDVQCGNGMIKMKNESEDIIYLLSKEEYKEYKDKIPHINTWWWLRSAGYGVSFAMEVCSNGSIIESGNYVGNNDGAVYPALKYSGLEIFESKDKNKDRFIWNETKWQIIDEDKEIAIAVLPIGFYRFDECNNSYNNSEIREWLLDWIKEA